GQQEEQTIRGIAPEWRCAGRCEFKRRFRVAAPMRGPSGGWPFRTTTGRTTAPLREEGPGLPSFALPMPRRPTATAVSCPPLALPFTSPAGLWRRSRTFAPGVFNEKNAVQRDARRRAARRDRRWAEADRHRHRVGRTRIPEKQHLQGRYHPG